MEADLDDITWVIREFGEDKHARRIAKAIVAYREDEENEPMVRTGQLAKLISDAAPKSFKEKKNTLRLVLSRLFVFTSTVS